MCNVKATALSVSLFCLSSRFLVAGVDEQIKSLISLSKAFVDS